MPGPLRRPGTILCLVLLTLLSLVLSGYRYDTSDHAYKIPFLKATINPELYPGDGTVAQRHNYVSFTYHVIAPLVRLVGIEWAYFVLHLACLGLLLTSVFVLARGLSGSDGVGLLAAAMMVIPKSVLGGINTFDTLFLARELAYAPAVLSMHFMLKRRHATALLLAGVVLNLHAATALPLIAMLVFVGVLWRPVPVRRLLTGLALLAAASVPFLLARSGSEAPLALQILDGQWLRLLRLRMPHHYFASTWLWTYTVFLPVAGLGLYALWSAPRRRTDTGVVLAFMASALMCIGGWFFTEVIAVQAIMIATPFRSTLIVFVLAVAVIARMLVQHVGTRPLSVILGTGIVACVITGHGHLLLVPAAGWIAIERLVPRVRHRALAALMLVGAVAGAGLVFLRMEMYFRTLNGAWLVGQSHHVLLWVCIGVLTVWLARRQAGGGVADGWPVRGLAAAAVLGTSLFLVVDEAVFHENRPAQCAWPWVPRSTPWHDVQTWARSRTPIDTCFITPPRHDGFRTRSERAVVGEWKDGAFINFSRRTARAWWQRMTDLGVHGEGKAQCTYNQLDEQAMARLSAKYRADYVVVERPRRLRLPLAYQNAAFRVYRVGDGAGRTHP